MKGLSRSGYLFLKTITSMWAMMYDKSQQKEDPTMSATILLAVVNRENRLQPHRGSEENNPHPGGLEPGMKILEN